MTSPSFLFSAKTIVLCLLWSGFLNQVAESAKAYESTASLELFLSTNTDLSAGLLYQVEQITGAYIESQIAKDVPKVLSLRVAVKNQKVQDYGRLSIPTKVSVIYVADEALEDFPTILEQKFNASEAADALQVTIVDAVVTPENESKEIDVVISSSTFGLTTAVICLSVALFIISSVVLYVTGGWSALKQCALSICFEEVVVENEIGNKDTFPVVSYDDDTPSIAESSIAGTAASGILGAISNDDDSNPAQGLGIKTPIRHLSCNVTGFSEYADSEIGMDDTPRSAMTSMSDTNTAPRPLGIMSMRKLRPASPETDDDSSKQNGMEGGMSRMILGRLQYGKK
eukprot:CAMPEP_0198147080 /NCGR_PEP_ID=MMETSP1443-20131203/33192_1 /TAXON_ID=186043 /ORGANISM="Entomoneis sp., Strain CCMP2396" /LENGTH=341 /DNA_ID=CAMNT_0043811235 /DNA_START=90 /DNA_END=1115 /DNA_ORIENTATION=-